MFKRFSFSFYICKISCVEYFLKNPINMGSDMMAKKERKKENDFNVHEANNSLWDRPPHTLISAVHPFSCSI
jgi:hypothetical protein